MMHLFTGVDSKSSTSTRDTKNNSNKPTTVTATPTSTTNPVIGSTNDKTQGEPNSNSKQVEDIFTKAARFMFHHWEHTLQLCIEINERIYAMIPSQGYDLIYWKNPIHSAIALCVSLSALITYMSMSALSATAFWLLGFLILVGLYKFYNFILANCLGRLQPDLFETIFPPDVCVSDANAQAFAEAIQVHGTYLMKKTRSLFLWENFTSSLMYGVFLLKFYYLGLLMNALTLTMVGLVLTFTVPKIYQVHQEPIDRIIKQVQDRFTGIYSKVSPKLPNKPKTN